MKGGVRNIYRCHLPGNALRSAVLQNPRVTFCGYSMPHPAEDKMFLRIQTVAGYPAQEALSQGLKDLKAMCQITKEAFKAAVQEHQEESATIE